MGGGGGGQLVLCSSGGEWLDGRWWFVLSSRVPLPARRRRDEERHTKTPVPESIIYIYTGIYLYKSIH